MFESIMKSFKKFTKKEDQTLKSKDTAKERLHLVLMQDRANVSADFLELMKQEIIEVIKKYIDVDEKAIDVRLTNKTNEDGTVGAPALYANIPITTIKNDARKIENKAENAENKVENKKENKKEKNTEIKEEVNEEKEDSEKVQEVVSEEVVEQEQEEKIDEEKNEEEKVEVTDNIETEKKAI